MKPAALAEGRLGEGYSEHAITVLPVDDQAMMGEAVRRMLAQQPGIAYHFCADPARALEMAEPIRPGNDGRNKFPEQDERPGAGTSHFNLRRLTFQHWENTFAAKIEVGSA